MDMGMSMSTTSEDNEKQYPAKKAGTGMQVILEMVYQNGETETLNLHIVPDKNADFAAGFLGEGTPLARAVENQTAGSVVPYKMGDVLKVRILAVEPASETPPEDVEARREETIRRAVSESDKANAIAFAASFSGKWGDYDPKPLDENWEKK